MVPGALLPLFLLVPTAGLHLASGGVGSSRAAGEVEFGRDVRPILTEHCFACHGPDEAAREGDLRLDEEAAARASGVFEGELVRRISLDADHPAHMPPAELGKPLTAQQVQVLTDWVAAGAPYDRHWSFRTPERPGLPEVQEHEWVRNPVDTFVLARLEEEGLAPAPEADRRSLARRLSLDLTGLPPDPAEVEAFVQDPRPDAYERLVERWLASDAWGEHRARGWLDVARYADTHGIHFDNYRDIWPYRDWVIEAFAADVPYDTFSIEQLAGDLLPEPTIPQRVATGYLRCNITTNEGGLIDEEYKVLYARDRTESFGQAWLGLTVGCAVCHDHKYDPLTQREFYGLSAYFDNTRVPIRDGNAQDPPPILRVTLPEQRARLATLAGELEAARDARAAREASASEDLAAWLASPEAARAVERVPAGDEHLVVRASGAGAPAQVVLEGAAREVALEEGASWEEGPSGGGLRSEGASLVLPDAGDFDTGDAFTCSAWVRLQPNDRSGALASRMDMGAAYRGWDLWLQGRRVGTHIIAAWPQQALKVVAKAQVPAERWTHVAITYDGSAKVSGVRVYYDGIEQEVNVEARGLEGSIRTAVPFRLGSRTPGNASGAAVADLRLHARVLDAGEVASLALAPLLSDAVAQGLEPLDEGTRSSLRDWWLRAVDGEWQRWDGEAQRLDGERQAIEASSPTAHVFAEAEGVPMAFVLDRGEYDRRGEQVQPGTPAFLPPMSTDAPASRLALAEWLFQDDHPLTARVAVNRFWQELFGTGLVATSGDLGLSGEFPSHPELLDWLAVEFRESGWRVKDLFRLLVTSATYRQAAGAPAAKRALDGDNRLLSRGPRFRMDAEMIRDTALAASGLLVREIGGPSVRPYQPPGVWEAVAMRESNTHTYRMDAGERLWRRSMYTLWKRAAPPASMEIFDAPNRETCAVRRIRTNTPLQALVTLNDPQFVEAARALAAQALRDHQSYAERMDAMMLGLASRPLADEELRTCGAVLADLRAHYAADPEAARALAEVGESPAAEDLPTPELAAWTMLANMLMNLDEVVTK